MAGESWRAFYQSRSAAKPGGDEQRRDGAGGEPRGVVPAQGGSSDPAPGRGAGVVGEQPDAEQGTGGQQQNARQPEGAQAGGNGALNAGGIAGGEQVQPGKPIEELSFIQRLRKSAPAQAIQEIDRGVGRTLVNFQQAIFPWSDEVAAAGDTAVEAAKRLVGLGQQPTLTDIVTGQGPKPLGDVYRGARKFQRGVRDEAAADTVSNLTGTAAAILTPGVSALKATGGAGRVLLGAGEAVANGLGATDAELTGDNKQIGKALVDAGIALGFAGAAAGVGALKIGERAEKALARQTAKDVTRDGLAVHRRRAVPNDHVAQMVVETGEKFPAFRKAFAGPRDELAAEAKKVIDEISPQVAPIYRQFDEADGLIPARDIVQRVDGVIADLQTKTQTQSMRDALGAVREDIVDVTRARASAAGDVAPQFGGRKNWSHQDVRDWVTQLLLKEQKTMGSLNETERAQIVNDLHDVADDFLRERMEAAAARHPELTKPLEALRESNRHLSAAIRVRDVAENADARQFHADTDGAKRAGMAAATGMGTAGAVLGGSMSGGAALLGAGVGAAVTPLAKGLGRAQTELMGRIARASRGGNTPAKVAETLIEAGVPQNVARAFELSLIQNRNAEREKKQ